MRQVMSLQHYPQAASFQRGLDLANVGFTLVFATEAALKATALRPWPYIMDNWNKLDLFIVVTSMPDVVGVIAPLELLLLGCMRASELLQDAASCRQQSGLCTH